MALSSCRHCGATIAPSLADDGHWLDGERSAACPDNQRLHAPMR